MSGVLLDTCAVIWTGNDDKLSPNALTAINDAYENNGQIYVSPISAWELGILVSRGRLRFSMEVNEWFLRYMDCSTACLASMLPSDLIASSFLPGNPPRDPSDRIIIATARQYDLTIITRDKIILNYAKEGHVKALAC